MLQADTRWRRRPLICWILFIGILQVMLVVPASRVAADDAVFDVANHKGKVVYVDFWASWCTPCRASFPFMARLKQEFGDDLVIAAINLDKNRSDADKFLEDMEVTFAIHYDPEGTLAEAFEVKGMPSSYLFDGNGQLVGSHVGFRKKDEAGLYAAVSAAIGAVATIDEKE